MDNTKPRYSTQAAPLLSWTFFTTVKTLEQGATMNLLLQQGSRFNPHSPKEILVQYDPELLSKQTRMVDNNWGSLRNQKKSKNMGDRLKSHRSKSLSPVFNHHSNPETKMESVALVPLWFQLVTAISFEWEYRKRREGFVRELREYSVFHHILFWTVSLGLPYN